MALEMVSPLAATTLYHGVGKTIYLQYSDPGPGTQNEPMNSSANDLQQVALVSGADLEYFGMRWLERWRQGSIVIRIFYSSVRCSSLRSHRPGRNSTKEMDMIALRRSAGLRARSDRRAAQRRVPATAGFLPDNREARHYRREYVESGSCTWCKATTARSVTASASAATDSIGRGFTGSPARPSGRTGCRRRR